jgi:hypothetical protein
MITFRFFLFCSMGLFLASQLHCMDTTFFASPPSLKALSAYAYWKKENKHKEVFLKGSTIDAFAHVCAQPPDIQEILSEYYPDPQGAWCKENSRETAIQGDYVTRNPLSIYSLRSGEKVYLERWDLLSNTITKTINIPLGFYNFFRLNPEINDFCISSDERWFYYWDYEKRAVITIDLQEKTSSVLMHDIDDRPRLSLSKDHFYMGLESGQIIVCDLTTHQIKTVYHDTCVAIERMIVSSDPERLYFTTTCRDPEEDLYTVRTVHNCIFELNPCDEKPVITRHALPADHEPVFFDTFFSRGHLIVALKDSKKEHARSHITIYNLHDRSTMNGPELKGTFIVHDKNLMYEFDFNSRQFWVWRRCTKLPFLLVNLALKNSIDDEAEIRQLIQSAILQNLFFDEKMKLVNPISHKYFTSRPDLFYMILQELSLSTKKT